MKRVFVAGHRGMVGAAIVRKLEQKDSIDQVYLAVEKVGGIHANDWFLANQSNFRG